MSVTTRYWCDLCGAESKAASLRPVFTVEQVPSTQVLWRLASGGQEWKPLPLGHACTDCMISLTAKFHSAPVGADSVDRMLEGLDL